MSTPQFRTALQSALQGLAAGNLRTSATALLATLGYASPKTLDLPTQPQAFAHEVENLLGGSKQLNPLHASLADWKSAAFLFQLTNDELPALAAGQTSLLDGGSVQAWQVESFVFLALDLKPGVWSRTRLAALTREINRLFPMPAILLFRHPREDGAPLLSISVIHRLYRRVRRRGLCVLAWRKGQQPLAGAFSRGVSQIQRPGSRAGDARGACFAG